MPVTAKAKLQTNPPTHYQRVTIIKAEKQVLEIGLKPVNSWLGFKLQVCCQDKLHSVHIYYGNILNNDIYIRSQQEGFDPEFEEKVKSSTCPASQEVHVKVTMKVSILLTAPRSAQPYGCSSSECQAAYRGTLGEFRHCGDKVAFQKVFLLPIRAALSVLQGVSLPPSKGNDYDEHASFCKGF